MYRVPNPAECEYDIDCAPAGVCDISTLKCVPSAFASAGGPSYKLPGPITGRQIRKAKRAAKYARAMNPVTTAPVECPLFIHNQAAELAAVQAMPVVQGGESVADAVNVAYYTAYPNAPVIPEGWENSPTCKPWAKAWLRIRGLAKRLGKWGPKPATLPPPQAPAPKPPGLKGKRSTSRYNKLAKLFGVGRKPARSLAGGAGPQAAGCPPGQYVCGSSAPGESPICCPVPGPVIFGGGGSDWG